MPVLRNRRLLFGILIAALFAIGGLTYWIVTSLLPPRQVVEFVRLLNGPEADFYNALQAPREDFERRFPDPRKGEVESFRRFKSRGKGPWRLTWWERSKTGNRFNLIVQDGKGNRSHLDLIMTIPGGKIGAVQYWPYVKGNSLDEIADSSMSVTGTRALAVAYWKDGKYECEVRGKRSLTTEEPLHETDRWPLQFSSALVQLATARLVEKGVLHWDEPIKYRFPEYKLPDWAQSLKLGDLFRSGNRKHFSANDYGKPVERRALSDRLKELFNGLGIEEGDARLAESNDMTVLIGIIQAATNETVDKVIEREVLRPLEMTQSKFNKPEIQLLDREARERLSLYEILQRGHWYVANASPISAPISDLMKLGVLKLEEESQGSDFLRSEQFAKLRSAGVRNVSEFKWEWWKRDLPEGTCYLVLRSSVMIGAFPKQNAVVIVAMPALSEPYTELGGPVFWRIAEEICGWPRKRR